MKIEGRKSFSLFAFLAIIVTMEMERTGTALSTSTLLIKSNYFIFD